MNYKYLIIGVLILIVAIFIQQQNPGVTYDIQDLPRLRGQLRRDLQRGRDPQQVYADFKQALVDVPNTVAHPASHVFGETLFDVVGIKGIETCDASFGFGCFHSFMGSAVSRSGVSAVHELDGICSRLFTPAQRSGCLHGIGHGLGEYFGPERITRQLEICASLSRKEELFGCSDGVFMEYHFPQQRILALEEKNRYAPCGAIGGLYEASCYLNLPSWWRDALREDWGSIQALCEGVADSTNREYCFLGIGYAVAIVTTHDVGVARATCDRLSGDAKMFCRAGASAGLFDGIEPGDAGRILCDGLGEQCVAAADMLSR